MGVLDLLESCSFLSGFKLEENASCLTREGLSLGARIVG